MILLFIYVTQSILSFLESVVHSLVVRKCIQKKLFMHKFPDNHITSGASVTHRHNGIKLRVKYLCRLNRL